MNKSTIAKAVGLWRRSPSRWVADFFPKVHLWSKQREILDALEAGHRRIAIKAAHAVSKSHTCGLLACWNNTIFNPSLTFTTAPTWRQVNAVLWKEIRTQFGTAKYKLSAKGPLPKSPEWHIASDQRAFGASSDKPDKLQGLHEGLGRVMCLADEACGIEGAMWPAIYSIVTGRDDILIAVGNPDWRNPDFMRMFADPSFYPITISAYDSPNFTGEAVPESLKRALVSRSWVDDLIATYGEDSPIVASKVRAEFPEEDAQTLIPLSYIEAAEQRKVDLLLDHRHDAGCDVARYGTDRTVIYRIDGNSAACVHQSGKISTMETAGLCMQQIMAGYRVAVDDTGVGGGVTDRVREQGKSIGAVNFGQAAKDAEHFKNARSEMFWGLRLWLRDTGHIESDGDLRRELANLRYKMDSSGKIQVESKDDIRKRLGKSPDKADALALAVVGHVYNGTISTLTDDDWSTGRNLSEGLL
jgi:phage terminase large subunit